MKNILFDLKIKELSALKKDFKVIDDILFLFEKDVKLIGCDLCYMKKPLADISGYSIEAGELVNYYEKFKEDCTVPKEVAINVWLCPKCNRVFQELMPYFDKGYTLCQPINH
jgi:hypothetical protein